MKTIAVIDGDIIAYRCAAANEQRSIKATHKITKQEIICPHKTAFKSQIKDVFSEDEFDILEVQTPEDIFLATEAIDTTIESIKNACAADEVEIYISGKDNFRDKLPLPTKYKGNRSGTKPIQLVECRKYLTNTKKAVVVDYEEVDDMLARRCYEGLNTKVKTIACTLDGDQNGVAGWMYNWTKQTEPTFIKGLGEIFLTKENKDFDGYGRKFFYAQWLLGDAVDCFKPCEIAKKKFGVVAMYKLLSDCKTDKECVQVVYNQYKSWYPKEVTYIAWDGVEHTKSTVDIMDMYAACAHMRRFKGDVFDTKKLLKQLRINDE